MTQPEKKTAVHRRKVASYYVSELSHGVLPAHALAVHPGQQLAFLWSQRLDGVPRAAVSAAMLLASWMEFPDATPGLEAKQTWDQLTL